MQFTVETDQETDGRWLAEVTELPGVQCYGNSQEEAIQHAEALALRVVADRIEKGELVPQLANVFTITKLEPTRMPVVHEARRVNLTGVRVLSPKSLELRFDDKCFVLPIARLEMSIDQFEWETVLPSSCGDKLTVKSVSGEEVPIDSSSLRYLVDPVFAAMVDKSIADLHMPPSEASEAAKRSQATLDPRWLDVGDETGLFE